MSAARLFVSDWGSTPSTSAVALLLLCLYFGGAGHFSSVEGVVQAVDVHGDDHHNFDRFTVGDHRHAQQHHQRAHQHNHHHFDHFTRDEEKNLVPVGRTPVVRREARGPTGSTGPSRDDGVDVQVEEHHADHLDHFEEQTPAFEEQRTAAVVNSRQYVVLEPNGAGVGGSLVRRRRRGLPPGRGAPSVKMGLAQEQQRRSSERERESEREGEAVKDRSGGDAARRESGSSGISGAGSRRRTGGALTIQAATASSEYASGDRGVHKLIDGDLGTYAQTGDRLPRNDGTLPLSGVGQKCPWFQVDLGTTQTVGMVKLSAPFKVARMRRLLFVLPMQEHTGGNSRAATGWQLGGDMSSTTNPSPGGVRVLVSNTRRDRAATSAPNASGRWAGTAVGSVCPEPPAGAECETIQCVNPATCLDRFEAELNTATDDLTDGDSAVGTAEVDCNGKEGRYVTIELPGITSSHPDTLRTLGLTEVQVDEATTSAAEGDAAGVEEEASEAGTSTLLVIAGVVVLLFGAVGVAFALGIFEAGPPQPTDAAPEAY